jgi:hypothetical protein
VTFEWIAARQIDVEYGVAFVAAELLEAGRMDAARHAGAQRAALKAVAAEQRGVEAGTGGACLDDPGDGAGVDCHGADAGQGGIAAVPAGRRGPDPPWTGSRPEAAAVRCMPAMVSATCASAVGTAANPHAGHFHKGPLVEVTRHLTGGRRRPPFPLQVV